MRVSTPGTPGSGHVRALRIDPVAVAAARALRSPMERMNKSSRHDRKRRIKSTLLPRQAEVNGRRHGRQIAERPIRGVNSMFSVASSTRGESGNRWIVIDLCNGPVQRARDFTSFNLGTPTGRDVRLIGFNASRAAVNMLTVQLAQELKDTSIVVNSVCPRDVKTNLSGHNGFTTPAREPVSLCDTLCFPSKVPSLGSSSRQAGSQPGKQDHTSVKGSFAVVPASSNDHWIPEVTA